MTRTTIRSIAILALLLSVACDDTFDASGDGGSASDAAALDDAGPSIDSGLRADTEPRSDSGPLTDAGPRGLPASSWIGIPQPPFGVDDSHESYAGMSGYTDGPDGPFTHYVDNADPGCSDASDGSEASPRCSIPTTLFGGAVVEVHGGPYILETQTTSFDLAGTQDSPVFLRGVGDPEIDAGGGQNRHWAMAGSYFIVEGFRLIGGATIRFGDADHYAFRHSEVDFGERNCVNAGGSFGVIYDNELHHCHRQPGPQDAHGVQILTGASSMWVLENDIHHNFGNGIQWGHRAESNRPDFVFIAGNTIHQDRETGIASKWSARSVMSSNTIYGYRRSPPGVEWCADDGSYCNTPSSGSAGQAIVSGADGNPQEEWIIYNRISDVVSCFRLESADRANYVGNVCFGVLSTGLRLEKDGPGTAFLHNTFFEVGTDSGRAMIQQDWRDNFADSHFANNVFHTTSGHIVWFEDFGSVVPTMRWDHNVHYNGGATFTIDWRSTQTISDLAQLTAAMGSDTASFENNLVEDPMLVDPAGGDFRPAAGSPLVGAANDAIEALDVEFQATFGTRVSIIAECWSDGNYDIGAVCAD